MPVKHEIWKVGDQPAPLASTVLDSEQQLEEMIVRSSQILSNEWMLIGQQEMTDQGGRIDLLAIAPDASLVLIELKRDRTPRDIVAQALDYASWVEKLTTDQIVNIYARFSNGGGLGEAFKQKFGVELDEESLNQSHQILLVASELDGSTERIVSYLNDRDVAINVMFFRVFQHGEEKLLSRTWYIDPGETQANVVTTTSRKNKSEPWNGEYYVSFGDAQSRDWEDARRYGYISAGGGSWYSQTLKQLSPGDRVWVNIPKRGYVGVGRVAAKVKPVNDFSVMTENGEAFCLDVLKHAEKYRKNLHDPDKAEYFVKVDWLDTVPETQAFNEVGLFGNQNTVCQPVTPKWRHTVDRLKTVFKNFDE